MLIYIYIWDALFMAIEVGYKLHVNYVILYCYGLDTGHVQVTIPGCLKVRNRLVFLRQAFQVTSINTRYLFMCYICIQYILIYIIIYMYKYIYYIFMYSYIYNSGFMSLGIKNHFLC